MSEPKFRIKIKNSVKEITIDYTEKEIVKFQNEIEEFLNDPKKAFIRIIDDNQDSQYISRNLLLNSIISIPKNEIYDIPISIL